MLGPTSTSLPTAVTRGLFQPNDAVTAENLIACNRSDRRPLAKPPRSRNGFRAELASAACKNYKCRGFRADDPPAVAAAGEGGSLSDGLLRVARRFRCTRFAR